MTPASRRAGRFLSARPLLVSLAVFTALAVMHTWPLASDLAKYSRVDNGDYQLNAWAIDWVTWALPRQPTRLFDANIFHPEKNTLAYSEPLILPALLVAPLAWLGASPIVAINVSLLAGLVLSAWAVGWYCRHVTDSQWAGLVGGSLAIFNAHTFVRMAHLQALHLELVPLVFVGAHAIATKGRVRDALWTGLVVAAQALTSLYLLVFTAWGLVCASAVRLLDTASRLRTAMLTGLAILTAGVAAWPVLRPYAELSRTLHLRRSAAEAIGFTATWRDYLYTGAHVHYGLWSHRFAAADALFPGVVALLLVVVALVVRHGDRRLLRMWAAVLAGSVLLSLLPNVPGFETLHDWLPPLQAIRAYGRAGQMALVAVAVLGAFGVAAVTARWPRQQAAVGLLLLALVNLEALRAPMRWAEFRGVDPIYETLASVPGAVAELPLFPPRDIFGNARYMVNATLHHRPLVNGYSGFMPPGYARIYDDLHGFPDLTSLSRLHALGVTHVVVHRDWFPPERQDSIEHSPGLGIVARSGPIAIFQVRSTGAH